MPFAFPGDELNEAEEEGGGKRRAEKRAASVRKQAAGKSPSLSPSNGWMYRI